MNLELERKAAQQKLDIIVNEAKMNYTDRLISCAKFDINEHIELLMTNQAKEFDRLVLRKLVDELVEDVDLLDELEVKKIQLNREHIQLCGDKDEEF